nr:SGNH/GDSL hydrolase family protein [Tropicibacter sp. R16_0]
MRVPLVPVLAAQAIGVRRKAQLLDEPSGPRTGRLGTGPTLRLLITGDSSAAGVGVDQQAQALSGQLVGLLSRAFTVEWRLEATTGHTTRDTIQRVTELHGSFDVAVTALGVNDVTRCVTRKQFIDRQSELMGLLADRLSASLILATGVPQMELFPALPNPLAWVLGAQARRLDMGLAQVSSRFPQVHHFKLVIPPEPAYAARDGYHPSALAYRIWAQMLADEIFARFD